MAASNERCTLRTSQKSLGEEMGIHHVNTVCSHAVALGRKLERATRNYIGQERALDMLTRHTADELLRERKKVERLKRQWREASVALEGHHNEPGCAPRAVRGRAAGSRCE